MLIELKVTKTNHLWVQESFDLEQGIQNPLFYLILLQLLMR